ncbi:glycoside hydrolase superfamily [Mariannaea sp. PMI_226]|nr:glycoside hydrolase superfamily [Mariannaea sp. PMI_226]
MLQRFFAIAPLLAQLAAGAPGLDPREQLAITTTTTTITVTSSSVSSVSSSSLSYSAVSAIAASTATSELTGLDGSEELNSTTDIDPRAAGKRNVLYFTNWGIYGANFQPQQIPADVVTHLLYAFLDIGSDGAVKSSDTYSDLEKHYPTDSWNDNGKNAYGCVKQLYMLKKKHRNFKTLLSIGGWTYSPKFAPVAADPVKRKNFVDSAVRLLADWGFDGVDIDWEYPTNADEANNYVLLLKEMRAALDSYAKSNKLKYRFLITVASPAGPTHYQVMNMKAMDAYIDAWHLMAYDYAGSWDSITGHQAALYKARHTPQSTPFRTNGAVVDYVTKGIAAQKIVMGMPLYGRSFANTAGMGHPFVGVGGGSIENGVYTYKDLPRPGAKIYMNTEAIASFSYDPSKKELVTYESPATAKIKAGYIQRHNLGGAMYWEASGDKTGSQSIIRTVAKKLGALESTRNMLSYPQSVYDNIRAGMPSS